MQSAALPRAARGRPRGARTRLLLEEGAVSSRLGRHEQAFARALIDGVDPAHAWRTYLAPADAGAGPADVQSGLRHALARFERAAQLQGPQAQAAISLLRRRLDPASPRLPDSAEPPPLDAWIAARCARDGLDEDFHSRAEWLALYCSETGAGAPSPALSALTHARAAATPGADRRAALAALAQLDALADAPAGAPAARPPAADDPLHAWLAGLLPARLQAAGLPTLGALACHIRREGPAWHRRVPGLGPARAARLWAWLGPLSAPWAAPPAAMPAAAGAPALEPAVAAWLQRRSGRTRAEYTRIVERMAMWAAAERGLRLSQLGAADAQQYLQFLQCPAPGWVQPRRVARSSPAWRPFRGPLSAASLRRERVVLRSLFVFLASAAGGVLR